MQNTLLILLGLMLLLSFYVADSHYCTTIDRVIDGDTFVVNDETLRLRDVDVYEIDTKRGKAAREYVRSLDGICYTTHGTGEYGRTLVKVTYNSTDIAALLKERGYVKVEYNMNR